ncbi:MAG: 3-octaprenyl-4-hydroxybenzoate carboxy-lyase partner protein [Syntrophorhabdus sp. PtaU1.Bin058]|nr:MAG: 3-octaprenyl-4-hydroxybenzoate carboxy-lyase partner protein [Syntrophorhabdus sp. PtaU1.Bin058]
MRRIIVGITGATGVIYGVRLLEALRNAGIETHLILSDSGKKNMRIETDFTIEDVEGLASQVHDIKNLASSISSGSFRTDGMVIAPCTVKTLSGVAHSYNDNLIVRAADVVLKERRRLILVVRETPLHKGHLELMSRVADLGGIILPPIPAFYHSPRTIDDLLDHTTGKILDLLEIDNSLFTRWKGTNPVKGEM